MLTLYQREECPYCTRVRRQLAYWRIPCTVVNVARLGSERVEIAALDDVDSAEVPVLVDGDTVLRGTDNILQYLEEHYASGSFGEPTYGLTRVLDGVDFDTALAAVEEALPTEGFGVLTRIDVQATLRKKLDVDHPKYVILGACNPPLAHQALTQEAPIGLLLPCNVVVTEDTDGRVVVSAIDPVKMFQVVARPDIEPLAREVRNRLRRVLGRVSTTRE